MKNGRGFVADRGAGREGKERGNPGRRIHPVVPAGARHGYMKTSTTDKIEGTVKEVKGKIKEQAGKMTGNPDLQDRGTAENLAGKVQKKVGDVKKVLDE
jgi:uncharacterized protein YjbJ (UPF0337 family)